MQRLSLVCLVWGLCLCWPADAGTIDLDLQVDTGAASWQVFAEVQGGSSGLDGFSFDVIGSGEVAITSSLNAAPRGFDGENLWGFKVFRSHGDNGIAIMATQDSVYGSANDSAKDALVLLDVGILAGSRDTISWDAKVLLASGTYSGVDGVISVSPRSGEPWSLLSDSGGAWSGPGNLEFATAVNGDSQAVPEPSTLVLLLSLATLVLLPRRLLNR